jgi:hypothetical protein
MRSQQNTPSIRSKRAGKKWYYAFMKRHPRLANEKKDTLYPAMAQKLNLLKVG